MNALDVNANSTSRRLIVLETNHIIVGRNASVSTDYKPSSLCRNDWCEILHL